MMPKKKKRRATRETLMIRIRVRPKRRMRKRDVIAKLLYTAETGMVPDDIEISWIDWSKGASGNTFHGAEQIEALQNFVTAMRESSIRVERAN